MSPVLAEFGKHLRALRAKQGLSQEDLAHEAGLHRNYVGGLERGEQNPTLLTLQKLAVALHLKIRDLVPKNR